ncbi:MAG: MATE family efflux transporter, partial [Oscillospiraceae bacterium]|nr:MATE family efflux transporter [Oscillospiraceae bacterium]
MALFHQKDIPMLEGPLVPKIIAFSVPLMISNLLQVLYSAADMIVVAQSGAEGAVGAIGTTGTPINLIINIFIGFSIGVNVLVARYLGR